MNKEDSNSFTEAYVESLANEGTIIAMEELINALSNKSQFIRKAAAESLAEYETEQSMHALILVLNDPKELVRVAAAESLGIIGDQRAVPSLIQALSDKSSLSRGWIVDALGNIGKREGDVVPVLETMLTIERNSFVRLNVWQTLYKFGFDDALSEVLLFLKSKSYRTRCAVSNILADIVNRTNYDVIEKALREAINKEKTDASRGSMEKVLKLCEACYE